MELGEEATPCRDVGLRDADDAAIWQFAMSGGWCIVTKDEDFALRRMTEGTGPPVVWLRIGNREPAGGVAMEKQKVQAVLDSFGGDVDVDAFLERLAVLDDIERGERQIAAGDVVQHDAVRERIERICQ